MADLTAEWVAETARRFDALMAEQQMVLDDTKKLMDRVLVGYVVDPPDAWVPPVIDIKAERASVKEG